MKNLIDQFIAALQDANHLAKNNYLTFLKNAVEKVTIASQNDTTLSDYVKTLSDIAKEKNFALDPDKTNDFAQLLGEAHFYLICKNNNVLLKRIIDRNNKAPDFKFELHDMYFEVKTLSVVSGASGIKQALEDSFEAHVEIDEQLSKGKRIASAISVVQPYGEKPYQKGKGTISAVIDILIEKTRQNIKSGQFPNNKSFLVINLSIIPPCRTDNYVLRPAYCDDYMFKKAVSGELWMMAFAHSGMVVLGNPEFEGKPCVKSIMEKTGILADPEFNMVSGILFMIHPWQRDTEIWGLYNYERYVTWCDNEPEIIKTLQNLTCDNWNDDKDTNGWQLHGIG